MRRIGMIGVGLLGGAVAGRLLDGGFEVVGYDTRPEALAALAARGLRAAATPAEAVAGADAVFTILPTLDVVERVILGPGGLVDTAPRTATILQMSTISPELTRRLHDGLAARGLVLLDTPMSGTSSMVERGDCTIFAAGDPGRVEACRPVFDAIARRTHYVGAAGAATVAKLATNLLVGVHTVVLAEALALGAKGGLEPGALLAILRDSAAASRMLDVRGPLMAEARYAPQMKLELFMKDFALMLAEGRRLGVPLPLTSVAHTMCQGAAAAGHGGDDIAVVHEAYRRLAGLGDA